MMNNQKDTQKTDINTYAKSIVSDEKSLFNMPVLSSHEFANKKTEKLVTALYMVSDCMETDDALKGKLRSLGIDLLSDIYKLGIVSLSEKRNQTSICLTRISEILSLIEISYTIGFISEMNTAVLKKEFSVLSSELKNRLTEDKHFTFALDEKMFQVGEVEKGKEERESPLFMTSPSVRPLHSFTPVKKTVPHVTNPAEKQDRSNKILSVIKDKKNQPNGELGVSIKDISLAITDCSEKTIQRELNTLVSKGQLKKTGSKRWSRYAIL